MALIQCPECERDVSNKAPACPHCGCPFVEVIAPRRTPQRAAPERKVTTQRTSKALKARYAISTTLVLIGFGIWMVPPMLMRQAGEEPDERWMMWGFGLVFFAGIWMLWTKLHIWWHHD